MHANKTSVVENLSNELEIVLTRDFDAPREMVFDACADPKQVVQWWGPNGFTTTIDEMDVRVGGRWVHTMHGPDGTDYPNFGIFTEVRRPEVLAHRHGGGRKGEARDVDFESIWTFEELPGNRTRVTLRNVFASAAARDFVIRKYHAVEGGKQTLDRLAEFVAEKGVAA
jgi:uncharacterized protein YndB with AHSA1/START domain